MIAGMMIDTIGMTVTTDTTPRDTTVKVITLDTAKADMIIEIGTIEEIAASQKLTLSHLSTKVGEMTSKKLPTFLQGVTKIKRINIITGKTWT